MSRPFAYGSIPPGWTSTKLRTVITRKKRLGRPDLPLLSVNLPVGVVIRPTDSGRQAPSEDLSGYQVVNEGDLVVNQLGKPHGALGVSKHSGIISPAYFVAEFDDKVEPHFMHHLLRTRLYISEYERRGKFMPPNQFDISWDEFRDIEIVLPPRSQQKAIADYLDRETARIDALIEKKRRLVNLVSSRTSQFVGSVCSGTNAADFEHWSRVPLKSLFSFSKGKDAQRLSGDYVGIHQGPYPVYSGQTVGDAVFGQIDSFDFDLPGGAILVATVGAEAMSCRIISGRFSLSQNCALMIPRSGTNVFLPFIVGQLRDLFLEKRSEIPDHMQPSLRIEDLNRFYVQIPSLETQESIASLVDNKWSKTSVLLKSLELQVGKLFERRSSVVSAVVTGELAIPKAAA